MALASRALRPGKRGGVFRRMRLGAPNPVSRPGGRSGLQFRARVRTLPRVAWAPRPVAGRRPALKWSRRAGSLRLAMPPLGRSGRMPTWGPAHTASGRRKVLGPIWARVGSGRLWAAAAVAVLVAVGLVGGGSLQWLAPYWEAAGAPLARWVQPDAATAARIVARVAPYTAPAAAPGGGPEPVSAEVWAEARAWLRYAADRLPRWMLVSEIPGLAPQPAAAPATGRGSPAPELTGGGRQPSPPEPPRPVPGPSRPAPAPADEPLVLIYHSHTSEMYREPGSELQPAASYHRFNSRETGVVQAGEVLAGALEARGVPVLHDKGIYDYPSHPRAYLESGRAVAALLQQYPSIRAVIDLHRDTPADMTATVAGRRVARVTLVVATAVTSGLPHPGWPQNLEFAQDLARVMNDRTPGLLDRILQVPNRRYNQELHPHALLVEVGSYHNTQEEANAAAELLAESLAEVVLAAGAVPASGQEAL